MVMQSVCVCIMRYVIYLLPALSLRLRDSPKAQISSTPNLSGLATTVGYRLLCWYACAPTMRDHSSAMSFGMRSVTMPSLHQSSILPIYWKLFISSKLQSAVQTPFPSASTHSCHTERQNRSCCILRCQMSFLYHRCLALPAPASICPSS